jgi:hypothetical protein
MDNDTDTQTVDINVHILHMTEKAVLVSDNEEEPLQGNTTWIPLSQIIEPDDLVVNRAATLTIPEWFAIDRGLV